jgi:hypothetical protein
MAVVEVGATRGAMPQVTTAVLVVVKPKLPVAPVQVFPVRVMMVVPPLVVEVALVAVKALLVAMLLVALVALVVLVGLVTVLLPQHSIMLAVGLVQARLVPRRAVLVLAARVVLVRVLPLVVVE